MLLCSNHNTKYIIAGDIDMYYDIVPDMAHDEMRKTQKYGHISMICINIVLQCAVKNTEEEVTKLYVVFFIEF